jgi:hypothetical protein
MSAENPMMLDASVFIPGMLLVAMVAILFRYHNYKGKAQFRLWLKGIGFEVVLDSQEDKNPNPPNLKLLDATQQNSVEVLPESPNQIHIAKSSGKAGDGW